MKRFTDGVFKTPAKYKEYDELGCLDRINGEWILDLDKFKAKKNSIRIDEINKRLNEIVFEAGKNDLFYKDANNYLEYKQNLSTERDNLIIELKNLGL